MAALKFTYLEMEEKVMAGNSTVSSAESKRQVILEKRLTEQLKVGTENHLKKEGK